MTTPLLVPPQAALDIVRRLKDAGHEAYLCGGCVRDALMGAAPKDFDITTSAHPDAIERLFPKTLPIGKAFGVILVVGDDDNHYEVATFRSEAGYSDGRRPDRVVFSTAREDASRRDFTINALFYDPFKDEVLDFVGGRGDLDERLLRTVGDPAERFREDHLRLLRAVRFAARTGFAIEPRTWDAMREMAPLVASVSPERIAAETETMLANGYSEAAFRLYKDSGLLAHTLPEVDKMAGVEQPPDYHPEGDVWVHTLLLLRLNDEAAAGRTLPVDHSGVADVDPRRGMHRGDFTGEQYLEGVRECRESLSTDQALTLAWSGLLHDIGKPDTFMVSDRIRFNNHDLLGAEMAVAVLERLRRPRKIIDWTYDLIRRHIHFSTLRKMRKSKLRRWLQAPAFAMHMELHRMDCVSSHRMLANWWFGLQAWREEKALPPQPEPLLRGGDLVALGLRPGPEFGKLLRRVEDARLEGDVATREEALEFVKNLAATEGESSPSGYTAPA